MPIHEHPATGAILMCNFDGGFRVPEMVKRRPVVVLSPKIRGRHHLCTVVSLSTDTPDPIMPYHCQIDIRPRLPAPWESDGVWVKGDMVNAVGFHRLDLIRAGKDIRGNRLYRYDPLDIEIIKQIRSCVLRAMGMSVLTKHL
jgi:uncharacterized protein YifN (PemK superfamily)